MNCREALHHVLKSFGVGVGTKALGLAQSWDQWSAALVGVTFMVQGPWGIDSLGSTFPSGFGQDLYSPFSSEVFLGQTEAAVTSRWQYLSGSDCCEGKKKLWPEK